MIKTEIIKGLHINGNNVLLSSFILIFASFIMIACSRTADDKTTEPSHAIDISIKWESLGSEQYIATYELRLRPDSLIFSTDCWGDWQRFSQPADSSVIEQAYSLAQSNGINGVYTDTISPYWVCKVRVDVDSIINSDFARCEPLIRYLQSQSPLLPDLCDQPQSKWRIYPMANPDYKYNNDSAWNEICLMFNYFFDEPSPPYQIVEIKDNNRVIFTSEKRITSERKLTKEEEFMLNDLISQINPHSRYTSYDTALIGLWAIKITINGNVIVNTFPHVIPGMPVYEKLYHFFYAVSPEPPEFWGDDIILKNK